MTSVTSAAEPLTLRVEDGIAWIVFDSPGEKINKLSRAVMERLDALLAELAGREDVEAAVFASAKEGMFIAGADVREIEAIDRPEVAYEASRRGHAIFGRIRDLPFPAVAAIDGVCLGGGTELALHCHGRLGTDHPRFQIGLPEVNLGIIPAWGGTTWLPRLVGLRAATEMILTGRAIDANRAERMGLVDRAVPHQQVREHAVALARELAARDFRRPRRRRRGAGAWLLEANPLGRRLLLRQARKRVLARTRGHYPAPLAAIDVLRRGFPGPVERSLELEARTAADLIVGPVAKNLVHLFFLSERAKKDPGVEPPPAAPPSVPRRAAVLGAGTMGGGIAWLLSYRDVSVRLKDIAPEALAAGLRTAHRLHEERRRRGRQRPWDVERRMALIRPSLDWRGFGGVEIVLEAVVEDMEIKKSVFRELEAVVSRETLIGTNTSTLPVSELQTALERPERMAGLHFFNPVDKMPLVEVIRGRATSPATVAAFVAFAHALGKTPVVVADGPGFLVNRILGPYLNEAGHLLVETGDVEGIDRALVDFGMPMGPLRLLDEVGIDVAAKAGKVLAEAFGERAAPAGLLERLVAAGRLGKKTGRGFYRHEGKRPRPDEETLRLLGLRRRGRARAEEVVERSVNLMIAEASRCLDEGIARGAGDVDLAMVMGTGFPPFRGGLLRYADTVGLAAVVAALERWQASKGARFEPPAGLVERARKGHGFYERETATTSA